MNMYAQDLKVCMTAMELAFERMHWDYVEAFQREGMDIKDIPDDLHDASKAMQKVRDAMYNCNKLLHDVEKTNAKKRFEERQNARRKSKNGKEKIEYLPKSSGRYPWGSEEKTDVNS